MQKRGQITVYMIIGIIIVLIIGILLSTTFTSIEDQKKVSIELQPVQNFVESCLQQTARNGVIFLALQGGYYNIPKQSHQGIPYYYANRQDISPDRNTIQNEMANYIDDKISNCLEKHQFVDKITYGISTTLVIISNNSVQLNLELPTIIESAESKTSINKYSATVNSNYGQLYDISKEFIRRQMDADEYIELDALLTFIQLPLKFHIMNYDDGNVEISILDQDKIYKFALRLDWSE
tara:strand:+ start:30292 stop:31002 length:711 start_codon:yes stop_codon:yes gene_type:complete